MSDNHGRGPQFDDKEREARKIASVTKPADTTLNGWLNRGYGNRQAKILTEPGEGWTNFFITVCWRTSYDAEYTFAVGEGGSIEDAFIAAKRDPFSGVPE